MRRHLPTEEAILTHTENISASGVRVIAKQRLEVMMEVDFEIDLMDTLPTITSQAMIRRVEGISYGREKQPLRYDIGIQFITLEDEARRRIETIVERLLRQQEKKKGA